MNRREFIATGAAFPLIGSICIDPAAAQTAIDALVERAIKAGEKEVVVAGGTGAYGEMVKKTFYDPFTAATGIRVVATGGSYGEKLAKLKAMSRVKRVEWDVLTLSVDSLTSQNSAFFRDLGTACEATPNVAAEGVEGACLRQGAIFDVGGGVLAYSSEAFPPSGPQPVRWADFWNVKDFPGPRALPNIGTPWWNLVAALLADGVSADTLFPLDIERAFRKLDEIKPHVTVWWRSGDQSQQIFRSKEVVMAMMFAGRSAHLQKEGLPIEVSWQGAPLDASFWGVLKEAPHANAGLALINFIYSRPAAHADFIKDGLGATGLKTALPLLEPAIAKRLATDPANWPHLVRIDRDWLGENQDAVLRRWLEWLAK
jgi:mannopine transport system substrate-binding protein